MKLAIVVGTRPEVIKMAPLIRLIEESERHELLLIHSNQHYSKEMDGIFFQELKLPAPLYNLEVGSGTHSNQTGNILIKLGPIFEEERPDIVLTQGDTNTVLSSAMAAAKLQIPVGHVEAGLRSYDRKMPEETNRVITDHTSDFLFAVTKTQKNILLNEGIAQKKVHVVGNTIVDAVLQNKAIAQSQSSILSNLSLTPQNYTLFTAHRADNVDTPAAFKEVLDSLMAIKERVVWPIHLRARKNLEAFGLELPDHVTATGPLGYFDFLCLEQNANMIITDSGGLQEEACILGVPCITIRENTERPETVEVGANILVGRDPLKLKAAISHFASSSKSWDNPFGQGNTSEKILSIVTGEQSTSLPSEKSQMINVIGLGYMGLPTASLLAKSGHRVTGVDLNEMKVKQVNDGECPFYEEGLGELVKDAVSNSGLKASLKVSPADIHLIAVPTPHRMGKCDLSMVKSACQSLLPVVKSGDLVIIESTVRPRTCIDELLPIFNKNKIDVQLAHCPERAIPGNTLFEIIHNDRVIGATCKKGLSRATELYKGFVRGEIFQTDITTAECVKLIENTSRDVSIAFANELSEVLEDYGVNPWEAIALANKHPRVNILSPGPGVGGHCIAVDPWFLCENTEKGELIRLSRKINDERPRRIVEKTEELIKGLRPDKVKNVALLGVAYKKNVDDARETPALKIYEELKSRGYEVRCHDPHVKDWDHEIYHDLEETLRWSEFSIIITDHDEYKNTKFCKTYFDTRNIIPRGNR